MDERTMDRRRQPLLKAYQLKYRNTEQNIAIFEIPILNTEQSWKKYREKYRKNRL